MTPDEQFDEQLQMRSDAIASAQARLKAEKYEHLSQWLIRQYHRMKDERDAYHNKYHLLLGTKLFDAKRLAERIREHQRSQELLVPDSSVVLGNARPPSVLERFLRYIGLRNNQ